MTDETAAPARRGRPPVQVKTETVKARITKFGAGKVFTGETPVFRRPEYDEGEHWFPTYDAGDIVELPRRVAAAQEELGHLEIQD